MIVEGEEGFRCYLEHVIVGEGLFLICACGKQNLSMVDINGYEGENGFDFRFK